MAVPVLIGTLCIHIFVRDILLEEHKAVPNHSETTLVLTISDEYIEAKQTKNKETNITNKKIVAPFEKLEEKHAIMGTRATIHEHLSE